MAPETLKTAIDHAMKGPSEDGDYVLLLVEVVPMDLLERLYRHAPELLDNTRSLSTKMQEIIRARCIRKKQITYTEFNFVAGVWIGIGSLAAEDRSSQAETIRRRRNAPLN